ncbi:ImmA/IrrE family metallo-endopeptidase [Pediococcus damnosus]|uniref:ImmA/IrrE family metallo-endopeptidase n=1 Tax=Pediococcus damnosus TaxID=51663 RepID=UPI001D04B952|nr:ImmA/IrrE family metallo-endopeptidase [Pediococcus damnosus]
MCKKRRRKINNSDENEIEDYLTNLATNNDIAICEADDLESSTPDTAITSIKVIVMNINFATCSSYLYRLSHELSHILYGDQELQGVYNFSEFGKRGEELKAHHNAVKLLLTIKRPNNAANFMDFYQIPAWLSDYVIKQF